jgi:hypothetical protein
MKKLFFAFALFLALFMLGCQENSITDPVLAGSGDKANTISPAVTNGTIPLEGILKVPGELNTYYTIKGTVEYTEQVSSPVETTSPSGYEVKVTLSADGTLNDSPVPVPRLDHNLWYFSSGSEDQIFASIDGKYKIEKVYTIRGRTDGLVLVCQFYVTTNSFELGGKWLSFIVRDKQKAVSTRL